MTETATTLDLWTIAREYNSDYVDATYSPEDDKLRLYFVDKPDEETRQAIKAAGFRWAPRQQVWFAMWAPNRAKLAEAFAGEIGDESTSLAERAADKAERLAGYRENRLRDATTAASEVERISSGIPMGQPILVGHHSEKRARKDAEKIDRNMKKAVANWDKAEYWKWRAAGVRRNASRHERPDVIERRIKKIESEIRKRKASYTPHANVKPIMQQAWRDRQEIGPDAEPVEHVWVGPKGRGGQWVPTRSLAANEAHEKPWIDHLEMRLAYERELLADNGGGSTDRWNLEVGGKVLTRWNKWQTILRLNKGVSGRINSVSTNATDYTRVLPVDEIHDYKPPASEAAKKVAKKPPLLNVRRAVTPIENRYHAGQFSDYEQIELTKKQYAAIHRDYKGTRLVDGAYRTRITITRPGSLAGGKWVTVFLTDSKEHEPPTKAEAEAAPKPEPPEQDDQREIARLERSIQAREQREADPDRQLFEGIREATRNGTAVKLVVADQLFETPPELAEKLIGMLDYQLTDVVLEPSAGGGRLIDALPIEEKDLAVVAVEINGELAGLIESKVKTGRVWHSDFLTLTPSQTGLADKVVMNPPFKNGADIKHVEHALGFLQPGGRLAAIVANGPRQRAAFMDRAEHWEELPPRSFKSVGTNVNAAIVVMTV